MNPKIYIVVDAKNKAISTLTGMVTVGAKVDVEVRGLVANDIPNWDPTDKFTGKSLRFRIVDTMGRDLVRYPLIEKDVTHSLAGDTWTVTTVDSADVFSTSSGCSVECNTDLMRKAFCGVPFNEALEFGVILDSIVDDAEYAVGKIKVRQWASASTEDPTVLPDWRETLAKLTLDLAAVEESKTTAAASATSAASSATSASTSATTASGAASSAQTSSTNAANSAGTATTKASEASASASSAAAQVAKYPKIADVNKHWLVWNANKTPEAGFDDTGVLAEGQDGTAATISVGTVTTGEPGSSATVTNVGTSSAAVFNFSIPKGDPGSSGLPEGGTAGQLLAKTADSTEWKTVTYSDVGAAASSHTHTKSQITDFPSDIVQKGLFKDVREIGSRYKESDMKNKINEILRILKGSACLAFILACGSLFAGVTTQTAKLEDLYNDDNVVTNITYSSDITTNTVEDIASSESVTNKGAVAVLTTATNALTVAITNKADKSELAGYLPLTGGTLTGKTTVSNILEVCNRYINVKNANGSTVSLYADGGDYGTALVFLPKASGTIALKSDIPTIPSTNALLKGNGSGGIVAATAGTDYLTQTTADGRYLQFSSETSWVEWDDANSFNINATVKMIENGRLFYVGTSWGLYDWYNGLEAIIDYGSAGWKFHGIVDWSKVNGRPENIVTYSNSSNDTAEKILTTAENTAGTIVARGYTPTNAVVALSRSVQYVSPNGGTIEILPPDYIKGGVRDWVVYVYPQTSAANLCLTNLVSAKFADDSVTNALPINVLTALYFTEVTSNCFAVGRAELKKGW